MRKLQMVKTISLASIAFVIATCTFAAGITLQGNSLIDRNNGQSSTPGSLGDALNNLQRGVAPVSPAPAIRTIRLKRQRDGHFYADIRVNGVNIHFLVDTGASIIVLSSRDAQKIGVSTGRLNYSSTASTANGDVKIAPVSLRQMSISGIQDTAIDAFVSAGAMSSSLLGMSYLSKYSQIQIVGDEMVLHR